MITFTTIKLDELDALKIQSENFSAKIALQGGHLIDFYTHESKENWLWLGEKVAFKEGVAIRGGVPICFPLFGNYDDNPSEVKQTFDKGLAKHGLARTSKWELIEQELTDDKVIVTLNWQVPLSFNEQYSDIKFNAKLIFEFSQDGFTITLEIQNLGDQAINFTQAFHTYLPTEDIHQTRIEGFDNSFYVDMLKNNQNFLQMGDITFDQEVDRVYESSQTILLKTLTHQTQVTSKNSLSTVIWNPWIKKSKTLDQFLPNDYEKMVCIETANAGKDFVTLQVGEIKTLSVTITKNTD